MKGEIGDGYRNGEKVNIDAMTLKLDLDTT